MGEINTKKSKLIRVLVVAIPFICVLLVGYIFVSYWNDQVNNLNDKWETKKLVETSMPEGAVGNVCSVRVTTNIVLEQCFMYTLYGEQIEFTIRDEVNEWVCRVSLSDKNEEYYKLKEINIGDKVVNSRNTLDIKEDTDDIEESTEK